MERVRVEQWVARYEEMWRSPGTDGLAAIFAPDATYLVSPWASPIEGLAASPSCGSRKRTGPDEAFTMTTEVLRSTATWPSCGWRSATASPSTHVARPLGDPLRRHGTVRGFEEWPFAPDQPDGHG